jgi:hypothetical protein
MVIAIEQGDRTARSNAIEPQRHREHGDEETENTEMRRTTLLSFKRL